ncbi:MAG: ThiF family adenylyltransferase, partial [Parvularculaceae bacterium]|nr:ThiF family adenylyltransferase [Parvularculaceae bacterium]
LIVGAGGLGAPLIQYLAAAGVGTRGVGTLGLADDDVVDLSNLQRQTIFTEDDIGRLKVDAARDFVARLNAATRVERHAFRVDGSNAAELFGGYDLVVEGVDSFAARFDLNRAAVAARKPLVSAAVGRFDGMVSVFKPYAGADLPCYRCFTPEPPGPEAAQTCLEQGVLGPVTGIVGTLAALETLKQIAGFGEPLVGRVMIIDTLSAQTRTIALRRDPACPDCSAIAREG